MAYSAPVPSNQIILKIRAQLSFQTAHWRGLTNPEIILTMVSNFLQGPAQEIGDPLISLGQPHSLQSVDFGRRLWSQILQAEITGVFTIERYPKLSGV